MTLISVFFLLCAYLCYCLCFCLSLNSLVSIFISISFLASVSFPASVSERAFWRQKDYFAIITYDDVQRAVHHHCFRQGNHKLSPYLFLHNIRYKMLYDIHFLHHHLVSSPYNFSNRQNPMYPNWMRNVMFWVFCQRILS